MQVKQLSWNRLLRRWSVRSDSPERNLLISVIAQAITDECADAKQLRRAPHFRRGGFVEGMRGYCAAIGLDHEFLLEQLERAAAYQGDA